MYQVLTDQRAMLHPARLTVLLVTCTLVCIPYALAFYTKKGPVQLVDAKSFNKAILQSDLPSVVEFYGAPLWFLPLCWRQAIKL